MYQNLGPKPEGAIFPKRSKPQGGRNSTPHDTGTSMEDQLVTMNIQGGAIPGHRSDPKTSIAPVTQLLKAYRPARRPNARFWESASAMRMRIIIISDSCRLSGG